MFLFNNCLNMLNYAKFEHLWGKEWHRYLAGSKVSNILFYVPISQYFEHVELYKILTFVWVKDGTDIAAASFYQVQSE